MPGWSIQLLGGFELRQSGEVIELSNRKDRLVLAYLALSGGRPVSRDKLAGLLWADRGEEQARGSLRQSLAALRSSFGPDAGDLLSANRESIILAHDGFVVDVRCFEMAAGDSLTFLEAAAVYPGPLLDGMDAPSPEFDQWLRPERQRLEDLAASVVESLAAGNLHRAEPAIGLARQLLGRDRLREPVYRALMTLLARVGNRSEALRTYAQCEAALRDELGVRPASETEAVFREILAADGSRMIETKSDSPADERPSIAVIPFDNISRDPELDVLCDGLAEDITSGLGRFRLLSVVDRHSSSQIARSTSDAQEIGKLLGAGLVVQGSLQKQQDGLRLTVRLVDTATRAQKWSGQFNFTSADILSAPGKVMAAILPSINAQVENTLIDLSRRKPALVAYEHLLIGIRHIRGYEPGDNAKAIERFDRALAADPGFALAMAYRGFADIVFHGYDATPPDIMTAALSLIRKAAVIDAEDPRIWWLMGIAYSYVKDIDAEEKCYRRSIELNPSDANALAALALVMVARGKHGEGIALFREAFRLNPYHPEWYWIDYGSALYVCGRYEEAIEAFSQRREPQVWVLCRMAACYAQLDRMAEARAVTAKILKLWPDFRLSQQRSGSWGSEDTEQFKTGMLKAGLPS